MMRGVEGLVAIVTGGGSGIGAATARLLAEQGSAVVLVGRREANLREVADEVESAGGRALALAEDLGDRDAPRRIVAATVQEFGQLDVLVNNAASFTLEPIGRIGPDLLDDGLAVNIRAPLLLVEAALPHLRESPSAAVVNVSSAAAVMHRPGQTLYGLTKAAIEHATRSLAVELGPSGVRVNCVRPGPTETPIHSLVTDDPDARLAALAATVPLGRVGQPEDIARWIVALADPDRGAWVTGAVLPVDGGRTAGSPAG